MLAAPQSNLAVVPPPPLGLSDIGEEELVHLLNGVVPSTFMALSDNFYDSVTVPSVAYTSSDSSNAFVALSQSPRDLSFLPDDVAAFVGSSASGNGPAFVDSGATYSMQSTFAIFLE